MDGIIKNQDKKENNHANKGICQCLAQFSKP